MMKRFLPLIIILPFIWSCSNDNPNEPDTSNNTIGDNNLIGENNPDNTTSPPNITSNNNVTIADSFCANERKLKLLSTSLLGAFSTKGNRTDLTTCGGSNELIEHDSVNFDIILTDYCVNFRGQQYLLNGTIDGEVESGANFVSSIIPNITIQGADANLAISGNTHDGRANDMFFTLSITDNDTSNEYSFFDVNIKKGEIDFGAFSFDEAGSYDFQFIEHFNDDLTSGLLFIYGQNNELLILTAEDGIVTVVFKEDKQNNRDDGVLLDSAICSAQ